MKASKKHQRSLRVQGATFALLFLAVIGLIAWLSTRYHWQVDWTASGRHSLTPASVALLEKLPDPVQITAFARPGELQSTRREIGDLVGRYRQHKKDITLSFVDPDMAPDRVRSENIGMDGELVVSYQGRKQHVQQLSEQAITNALNTLARAHQRRIVFLQGHGERSPTGGANHDLKAFADQLRNKGLLIARHAPADDPQLPADVAVLVIASPQTDLFPGEVRQIQDYLERGGNLLWLAEPEGRAQLEPLAAQLGLGFHPGVVVDPSTQLLGIGNAAFALVPSYPEHAVTHDLASVTLFPFAAALDLHALDERWTATPILQTVARAWSETGRLDRAIQYDAGSDIAGPLTLGLALSRPQPKAADDAQKGEAAAKRPPGEQRVAVIGDGDFLSNAYLGNGANLELGERLINWLAHDDALIDIPPRAATDTHLSMTRLTSTLFGLGFLLFIPGALAGLGLLIWWRRRRR